MKNTSKILSLLALLLVIAMCFAACGNITGNGPDEQPGGEQPGGEQPDPAPIAPESIEISSSVANLLPGQSALLSKTVLPEGAEGTLTWVITEGADYAVISGDVLIVNADTEIGTQIKVKATIGELESNEISFIIGHPVTSITASVIGSTEIVKGNIAGLSAELTPANTSLSATWVFVEGADYATITANTLLVKADAPTGATISVKAVVGDVESNVLTFTVMATQDEINASKYYIQLSSDQLRIDKKGSSSPILSVEVYNRNGDEITDIPVKMTVVDGVEYLSLEQDGQLCYFTALGHGEATVEVELVGTGIVESATVSVIVPPDAVKLPEVFNERTNIDYAFSMVDPDTGAAESLPFVPSLLGFELACTNLAFNFIHESGAMGDEVAVYADGAITFKKTGKVTVMISSASGSLVEASTSYTLNINEGYNVSTFEELQLLLRSSKYTGQIINLVVLEKPDGSATGYTYGYDIVPPTALKPHSEQTVYEIISGSAEHGTTSNRLQAVNKSLYINGNNHKIDASQLRIFTTDEYNAYCQENGVTYYFPTISGLLSAEAWASTGPGTNSNVDGKVYSVNLYNLETVGNCPIDYDPNDHKNQGETVGLVGCYDKGISVGSYSYGAKYYVDADNLTSSAFSGGFNFIGVVGNSKVSNIYAYNCYSTGIFSHSNIMTFENLKFGPCGATGIEFSPEESGEAGLNDNENQHVILSGTIDASQNLNAGNTNYFSNYTIGGATIPEIINGNVVAVKDAYGPLGDIAVSHIQNANGEFIFVALLFMNTNTMMPNTSIVSYPEYLEGGIINIEDLPKDGTMDTTHQFIRMTIYVPTPMGNISAGTALFYNMNYGK